MRSEMEKGLKNVSFYKTLGLFLSGMETTGGF